MWKDDGLPADLPFFMTEGNMSWQSGRKFVDIMGGLWLADYVGAMLTGGASGTYFFHYLPWGCQRNAAADRSVFSISIRITRSRAISLNISRRR